MWSGLLDNADYDVALAATERQHAAACSRSQVFIHNTICIERGATDLHICGTASSMHITGWTKVIREGHMYTWSDSDTIVDRE